MPLYRNPKPIRFTPTHPVEKHFHDYDETWIIMGGSARAYMIDRDGERHEFVLNERDIWMIEAGVEHGCDPITPEILIFPFAGTIPEDSHNPGHYYMEEENYMPTLKVVKTPIDRYK